MIRFFNVHLSEWKLLLFAGDVLVFSLSVMVGLYLQPHAQSAKWFFWEQDQPLILLIGATYILILYIANLYDHYQDFRFRENFSRVILSSLIGTLLVAFLFYYLLGPYVSRSFLEWQGLAFAWLLALWRLSFSAIALPVRLQRQVLIVGAGKSGRRIVNTIQQCPHCGLAVAGFVDDDPTKLHATINGYPVLGTSAQLPDLIQQHKIGMVVVAITHEKSPALLNTLTHISFGHCQLIDMPSLYEFLTGKVPTDHISDFWLFLISLNKSNLLYRHIKQVLDFACAGLGLALIWPLGLLIAAAIKLDSPGPVFFQQKRLGEDGKPFNILKFRTMYHQSAPARPQWTTAGDPRITRVGRVLRKLHLDELPQLVNIIRGEMSLIGPRAEWDAFALDSLAPVPEYRPGRRSADPPGTMVLCGYKEKLSYYSFRLVLKPGITGWAQVMFPHAGSSMEDLKEKLQYDLYYIKNIGLFLDLAIMLKTVRTVLFGHGK